MRYFETLAIKAAIETLLSQFDDTISRLHDLSMPDSYARELPRYIVSRGRSSFGSSWLRKLQQLISSGKQIRAVKKRWREAKARMPKFSPVEQRYLDEHYVGRLATATKDGVPHIAAVCYANDQELLYVHTDYESRKGRNIQRNNRVAFIVDEYVSWERYHGVIAQGEAMFKRKGDLFERGRELIYAKYPKWEKEYPIAENESNILVIKPAKVISWNLPQPNRSDSP